MAEELGVVGFFTKNKEVIAAVVAILGLLPKGLEILARVSAQQKEQMRLSLERQYLEVEKLRHEIEKSRRELGEPIPPVSQRTGLVVAGTPVAAERPNALLLDGSPEWVRRLLRYRAGRGLLFAMQWIFAVFAAITGMSVLSLPLIIFTVEAARKDWSLLLGVGVVYILVAWGFYAMYRKVGGWRHMARANP